LVNSTDDTQDSEQLLEEFMGNSEKGREELIIEATSRTAMRKGDWMLIPPYKGAAINTHVNIELGNDKEWQLYNLKEDVSQQKNLAGENKEKLQELIEIFEQIRGKDYSNIQQLELK